MTYAILLSFSLSLQSLEKYTEQIVSDMATNILNSMYPNKFDLHNVLNCLHHQKTLTLIYHHYLFFHPYPFHVNQAQQSLVSLDY